MHQNNGCTFSTADSEKINAFCQAQHFCANTKTSIHSSIHANVDVASRSKFKWFPCHVFHSVDFSSPHPQLLSPSTVNGKSKQALLSLYHCDNWQTNSFKMENGKMPSFVEHFTHSEWSGIFRYFPFFNAILEGKKGVRQYGISI